MWRLNGYYISLAGVGKMFSAAIRWSLCYVHLPVVIYFLGVKITPRCSHGKDHLIKQQGIVKSCGTAADLGGR